MVRLIMGISGSGKTKTLLDLVRKAVDEEHGDVVVIEAKKALTYDIPYQARLIHAEEFAIESPELLRGFLSGVAAGNYDITHVFVDSLFKIIGSCPAEQLAPLLDWMDAFGKRENITITLTASASPEDYGEAITKYLVEA